MGPVSAEDEDLKVAHRCIQLGNWNTADDLELMYGTACATGMQNRSPKEAET